MSTQWIKRLRLAALVLTVVFGFGSWRYFRIPVELRFPANDALWQLAPYVVMFLALLAWWLKDREVK